MKELEEMDDNLIFLSFLILVLIGVSIVSIAGIVVASIVGRFIDFLNLASLVIGSMT